METNRTILGLDHSETLRSRAKLASRYRRHGRREEAEELQVQMTETRKKILEFGHLDALMSVERKSRINISAAGPNRGGREVRGVSDGDQQEETRI